MFEDRLLDDSILYPLHAKGRILPHALLYKYL